MATTLNGWKEIAAFLKQSVKTARRWESEGLPVHRTFNGRNQGALVFAFPSELLHWQHIRAAGAADTAKPRLRAGRLDRMALKRHRELRSELLNLTQLARQRSDSIHKQVVRAYRKAKLYGSPKALRQQAEVDAAIAEMSRKLVKAQEAERIRIGRELHDDVGQRLALLAIMLDEIGKQPSVDNGLFERIGEVRKQLDEILSDVQALSHELHSTRLEILGIVPAMKGMCRELGARKKIKITFVSQDVPDLLSPGAALCLYRVFQECLHNALKHSRAIGIQVQLRGMPGELHLVVSDSGRRFRHKGDRQWKRARAQQHSGTSTAGGWNSRHQIQPESRDHDSRLCAFTPIFGSIRIAGRVLHSGWLIRAALCSHL